MKYFKLSLISMGVCAVLLIGFLFYEVKKGADLKETKSQKIKKIAEAKDFRDQLEKLESELKALQERSAQIEVMVPEEEGNPLALLKKITLLARVARLRNLEIVSGENNSSGTPAASGSGGAAGANAGDDDLSEFQGQEEGVSAGSHLSLKPHPIHLSFDSEYNHFVLFVEEILKLDRLITFEKIQIKRDDQMLPRLKITLTLSAYSFH